MKGEGREGGGEEWGIHSRLPRPWAWNSSRHRQTESKTKLMLIRHLTLSCNELSVQSVVATDCLEPAPLLLQSCAKTSASLFGRSFVKTLMDRMA